MYALIHAWKDTHLTRTPFITVKKAEAIYKKTGDELEKKYDVMDSKYGDDEYFDAR